MRLDAKIKFYQVLIWSRIMKQERVFERFCLLSKKQTKCKRSEFALLKPLTAQYSFMFPLFFPFPICAVLIFLNALYCSFFWGFSRLSSTWFIWFTWMHVHILPFLITKDLGATALFMMEWATPISDAFTLLQKLQLQ